MRAVTPTTPPKMKARRKRHEPKFKARVAIEALKGVKTIKQIGREFDVHPVQVSEWKKVMSEGAAGVFGSGPGKAAAEDFDAERTTLHSEIGELTLAVDFLRKKSRQLGL